MLEQLELPNAWEQTTNAWGFSLVGVEALERYPNATLVIVDPLPAGVEEQLEQSGLWQQVPSAQRFARKLTAALKALTDNSPRNN